MQEREKHQDIEDQTVADMSQESGGKGGAHAAAGDAAVKRMANEGAGHGGVVPLKPQVVAAIREAAEKVTSAELKSKKVHGMLLGTYIQAGAVKLPKGDDPQDLPASAFVCWTAGGGDIPEPGQVVDGNQAQHFFLNIGHDTYGPLPFTNPLAKS